MSEDIDTGFGLARPIKEGASVPYVRYSEFTTPTSWRTRDGRTFKFSDMSTDHLINTVAAIWRGTACDSRGLKTDSPRMEGPRAKLYIAAMLAELAKRDATREP